MKTVLVIPSSIESSLPLLEAAHKQGWKVIGASADRKDPNADFFDFWFQLPFIHTSEFPSALEELVERFNITKIWTSHAPTFLFLNSNKNLLPLGTALVQSAPYQMQADLVSAALKAVDRQQAEISFRAGMPSQYPPSFVASLMTNAGNLFGECREEKGLGFCAALADAPKGDIVEIGSFFGKSAYLLNRISAWNSLGATIVVDPWRLEESIQRDSPKLIQNLSNVWDWDLVFQGFLITTAASSAGTAFNYIRLPSEQAWVLYCRNRIISSREFGNTTTSGEITLLHIDGNHDKSKVNQDFGLWSQRLADGGWIVFDDYEWSSGDGPRIVADNARKALGDRVTREFVSGGALFLKVTGT